MHKWIQIVVVVGLMAAPGAAPAQDNDIPEAFRGTWDAPPYTSCGVLEGDQQIRIDAHSVQFFESRDVVKVVNVRSDTDISVETENYADGDEKGKARTLRLTLSGGGAVMTLSGFANRYVFVVRRCQD